MEKSLLYLWMLPLLIVSIAVASVRAPSTTIGVEPQSIVDPGLGPGSTFTVEVWVRDVVDLAAVEFKLGYDTSVLTATLIEYGDIFGPDYFALISEIYEAEGFLHWGAMEMFGEAGFTGDGKAVIITFSVDSSGESTLDLYETKLGDSSIPTATPIIHDALDGFFTNKLFHDVAVTNVTALPTEVEAGELVNINVTVTNEGNYTETFTVDVYADIEPYNYTYEFPPPVYGRILNVTVAVGDEITVGTQTVTDLASGNTTSVPFTWNTTDVKGNYTISAEAKLDLEEDTRDNLFIDGNVIVVALEVHNIGITSVIPTPTEVTIGENVTIVVAVKNKGNFNETFDVTVYYDGTAIPSQTGITLANGTSTTLSFTWDTTGVAEGTYSIGADASVVQGETQTADNTYDDGTVKVQEAGPAIDILLYAAVAAVAIAIIAAVIYIVKIRK